jgi:hypothetical protein
MNEQDQQTVEEDLRNAIENLMHVESMLTLLLTQDSEEEACNTEYFIALARDVLSDATNDLKDPIEKLINQHRRRIERRDVVVSICG